MQGSGPWAQGLGNTDIYGNRPDHQYVTEKALTQTPQDALFSAKAA